MDNFNPKVLATSSWSAQQAVAGLLNRVESDLAWPAQIALIVYFLLPKPDGGDRPIGIMAGMVRLWERARLPIMKKWLTTVVRRYGFAQAGCTAE